MKLTRLEQIRQEQKLARKQRANAAARAARIQNNPAAMLRDLRALVGLVAVVRS